MAQIKKDIDDRVSIIVLKCLNKPTHIVYLNDSMSKDELRDIMNEVRDHFLALYEKKALEVLKPISKEIKCLFWEVPKLWNCELSKEIDEFLILDNETPKYLIKLKKKQYYFIIRDKALSVIEEIGWNKHKIEDIAEAFKEESNEIIDLCAIFGFNTH